MLPIRKEIRLTFSKQFRKKLGSDQMVHLKNIELHYVKLYKRCVERVVLVESGTHKEWIEARVKLHVNSSVIRLLCLCEAFCDCAKKFNGPGAAALVKSMVEIPMHLGHLLWILRKHSKFEDVRHELDKMAFGKRDPQTGLTSAGKVSGKDLEMHSQEMLDEISPSDTEQPQIMSRLYKDSNATGHHNHEARMYTGRLNAAGIWEASDRIDWFIFLTKNIFQLFLFCDTTLFVTGIFMNKIEDQIRQMPDWLE